MKLTVLVVNAETLDIMGVAAFPRLSDWRSSLVIVKPNTAERHTQQIHAGHEGLAQTNTRIGRYFLFGRCESVAPS
jgi:hypothetical protein